MAENDVGGIGVKFTADAAQLKQELTSLEQRLKAFNQAHGQTKVKLQASLVMPGNRVLADFRRDIEKSFQTQGGAGPIKARIDLLPPTAAQIKTLKGQIGKIEVDVIGNFKWGNKPPKSVTVEIHEKVVSTGRKSASASASDEAAPTVVTSSARKPAVKKVAPKVGSTTLAKGEIERGRVSPSEVWGPHFYPDPRQLLDMLMEPGGGSKRAIREELVRRGMTWPQIRAIETGGTGGTGGPRGLTGGATGAFAGGGTPVPHYSATGIAGVPAARVAGMARRGELDMPARSIYDPYARGRTGVPATIGKIEASGLTEATMARNLRRILAKATPESTAAGTGWYQRAGELTQRMAAGSGVGRTQAAAATAVFSSQAAWEKNVRNAQNFFDALRAGAKTIEEVLPYMAKAGPDTPTKENIQKALDVAHAPGERAIEQRLAFSRKGSKGQDNPKVREFWRGLMGDPNAAVIDRHQAMMMSGGQFENPVDARAAAPFQRALRRVARERGDTPANTQAISWATILGHEIAGADPHGMMRANVAVGPPGRPGGSRGFADPYAEWRLREQRASMREASQIKGLAGDARESAQRDRNNRAYAARSAAMTPEEIEKRNAELGDILFNRPWGGKPGGSRGFTGSPFGDPLSRSGSPHAVGYDPKGIGGSALIRIQSDAAQLRTSIDDVADTMAAAIKAGEEGFTVTQAGARVRTPEQIRQVGRFVTPVGQTGIAPTRLGPAGAVPNVRPEDIRRTLETMSAHPENAAALAAGGVWGGWTNPETGKVELDVNKTFGTRREAQEELARNPSQIAAFDLLKGQEVLRRKTQARVTGAGTFKGSRFAGAADLAAAAKFQLPSAEGVNIADLESPAFYRQPPRPVVLPTQPAGARGAGMRALLAGRQIAGRGSGMAALMAGPIRQQQIEQLQAAEPAPGMGAGPTLQEQQENLPAGGGGGGGGRRRPPAGAGAGDDEVGQPRPGGRVAELLGTIEQGKFAVQGARQAGQIRAVGTTVASQLGGLLGRGVDVVKINEMTTILGKMGKVVEDNRAKFDALDDAVEEFGAGSKKLEPFEKALQGPNRELEKLNKQFQALQPNKFLQMATGLTASIGGTIIGLGLFQGVTTALEGVGHALEEPTDRLLGFRRTGERTAVTLGQTTRQMNGFSEGAVAATTAQSGLGDTVIKQIGPLLEQRAAVEAGNSAFKEQLDLIRSAGFFERNPGAGLTQTTGGILGTPIGGTQPFLEQFLQSGSPVGGPLESRAGRVATNIGVGAAAGAAFGTAIPIPGLGTLSGALIGGAIGGISGLLQTADEPESATLAARARGEEGGRLTDEETNRLDEFRSAIATVNDGLEKANPQLAKTAHFVELLGNAGPAADAAVEATQKLLSEMPGITDDQLQAAKDLRFALIDPNTGKAATVAPKGFTNLLTEALRGVALPSREQAAFQSARGINAQLQLNREQGRLQRESIIPGQSFMRQLLSGRAPGGAQGGVQIPNPLTAGTRGLPPEVLGGQFGAPGTPGAFTQNIDTSQLTTGLGLVQTQANKGRDALVGMIKAADTINKTAGVPSNLLQRFNDLTEQAGAAAFAIRGINQASAWMQVNLQVKQINEQVYVMNRSLQDAKSFLSGAGEGELGLLQHRARGLEIAQAELGFRQQTLALLNQELGIKASTLQLEQRQRQINFQRAIAGFVTPGQTPEEIAARQKEAKLEADFAQKGQDISVEQLDNQKEAVALQREGLAISKEQFAVQQAMVTVSAQRAIGDLSRGIALLQEQARVTVQLQVNTEAVEAYQAYLDETSAQIEQVITEAFNTHQTILTAEAQLIASYEGTIAQWNNTLLRALGAYVAGATSILNGFQPVLYSSGPGPRASLSGESAQGGGAATGRYGMYSTPTQITVGEAGPETVAIIRNPRSMAWTGGGGDSGSVNINIMVSGNNVGNEQDADELATVIARKVEETMSRRSSLLGLRAN